MKRNIRIDMMYEGTKYQGWQRLGNSELTIQGKIEHVLSQMTGEKIEIIGSGRTDAGVHAYQQVANFQTQCGQSTTEIRDYLNQYLPMDIVITKVTQVGERFHSRYNVVDKTYVYRIWTKEFPPVFERPFVYWLKEELNLDKMKEASLMLIGEHDFQSFTNKKTKKSTVRHIKDICFEKTDDELKLYFTADGFLYNMVRILVGTLIEIGLEKRQVSNVEDLLSVQKRSEAGEKAPAQGLTLYSVHYH